MNNLLSENEYNTQFIDTFRKYHPDEEKAFTCWCTKTNARQNNFGSRIDYILADKNLSKHLSKAEIHSDVLGSDHCPISATFNSLVPVPSVKLPSAATKFYAEFLGGRQQTLKRFLVKPVTNPSQTEAKSVNNAPIKKRQLSLNTFFAKKPKLDSEISAQIEESFQEKSQVNSDLKYSAYKELNSSATNVWKQMFKPRESTLCKGHSEPCVLRTVKKKGTNQGRQFWACPRGEGMSTDKNSNCGFFLWAKPSK